jgi:uncharacterized membrane protein
MENILHAIEYVALGVESLAIGIIVIAIVLGTCLYLMDLVRRTPAHVAYTRYKGHLGRGLLLGLEILVAADIIRTVALDPTLKNIAALGLLVLIRTFLAWSLAVEIEGHWPWHPEARAGRPPDDSE